MMRALMLAAAVAFALTGPAQAVSKLSAEKCSELNGISRYEAERALVVRDQLKSRRLELAKNINNRGKANYLGQMIRTSEEDLREARAAAAEYSTIWRNLCKD